jgi:hypothetical protein
MNNERLKRTGRWSTQAFSRDALAPRGCRNASRRSGLADVDKSVDPGRYLILIRQHHRRTGAKSLARESVPAGV